jgi:hypothetical protein
VPIAASEGRPLALRQWPALMDGAVDGLLIAFAGWTLFYEVALAVQRSVRWAGWPWLVVTVAVVVGTAVYSARTARTDEPHEAAPVTTRRWSGCRSMGLTVAFGAIVLAVLLHSSIGLTPLAVLAVAVLLLQLVPWWSRTHVEPESHQADGASAWEHLFALAASLGLAVLGSLLLRPDADDAFYVNRATWVAHHGVPVINDTMFSPGSLKPAYDGGLPTPSIEALQGTLGHAFHLQAATVAYVLSVPLLSAIFGWVTWRLVRAWAPRRRALVLAIALAFVLASGRAVVGNYSIGRIWQGKVTAYAVLLPVIWLYLSRVATRARRWDHGMLLVAGIAFVGLTTTSALLAPAILGAGVVAAITLRSKSLLWGSLLLFAAPLVNGVAEKFGPAQIGPANSAAAPPAQVFAIAFGSVTMLALLAVIGIVFGPRLVVGRAATVAAATSLATMAAFLPGVLGIANAATGAGPVIWRLAIGTPTGVLVGLLVSVRLPQPGRVLPLLPVQRTTRALTIVLPTVVVLAVILLSGTWLWSSSVGGTLTSNPTWKVSQPALSDVRAAQRLDVPPGRWLLPPVQMQIMSISTAGPYTVVPRSYYLPSLDVPHRQARDRAVLLSLVSGGHPAKGKVASALTRLNVTLACVPTADRAARRLLAAAVGQRLQPVRDMSCHISAPKTADSHV